MTCRPWRRLSQCVMSGSGKESRSALDLNLGDTPRIDTRHRSVRLHVRVIAQRLSTQSSQDRLTGQPVPPCIEPVRIERVDVALDVATVLRWILDSEPNLNPTAFRRFPGNTRHRQRIIGAC